MKKIELRVKLYFNRLTRKVFLFLMSSSFYKYLGLLGLSIIVVVLFLIYKPDFADTILATMVGFFLGTISVYLLGVLRRTTEDYNKVTSDKKFLDSMGYDEINIIKFKFNETEIVDYFYSTNININNQYRIIDTPNKHYKLDSLIEGSYFDIMKSHGGSIKHNELTTRLDDVVTKGNVIELYTSRSNFFNHLVTNRAADYLFNGMSTIRKIFEPGPLLNSYHDSKMSNHIGINAFLVINNNGKRYLVISKRGAYSTISKKIVTSAIASRLITNTLTKYHDVETSVPFEEEVTKLFFNKFNIDMKGMDITIKFLGFGQHLYEAGKPQFYYLANKDLCNDSFSNIYDKIANNNQKADKIIDADTKTLLIDLSTLKYHGDDLFSAKQYIKGERLRKICFVVEKSFLVNLYYYNKYINNNN